MIKVKTNEKHRMGTNLNLPFLGEVDVSQEGYVQVETREKADNLIAANIGFFYDDSSFLNHVGSEEELVGQNDSLKDSITALTNEKTLFSTNLKVSEERNVKLNSQLTDTSLKLKAAQAEIVTLRQDLETVSKAYKEASLGFETKASVPSKVNEVEVVTPKVVVSSTVADTTKPIDNKKTLLGRS